MNATHDVSPLTADHYDRIQQGLSAIYDANQLIARAAATGMDTRAHQELASYYTQQLTALKTHFFPKGRPT